MEKMPESGRMMTLEIERHGDNLPIFVLLSRCDQRTSGAVVIWKGWWLYDICRPGLRDDER